MYGYLYKVGVAPNSKSEAEIPTEVHPTVPKPSEPHMEVVSRKDHPDGKPSGKPSGTAESGVVASKPPLSKRALSSPGPEPPAARPKPSQRLPSLPSCTAKPKAEPVVPLTPTEADGYLSADLVNKS